MKRHYRPKLGLVRVSLRTPMRSVRSKWELSNSGHSICFLTRVGLRHRNTVGEFRGKRAFSKRRAPRIGAFSKPVHRLPGLTGFTKSDIFNAREATIDSGSHCQ